MIQSRRRVKSEDSDTHILDLKSPLQFLNASSAVRTRKLAHKHNDTDIYEILSSEDEMEVEAALRPSGASSDPPQPLEIETEVEEEVEVLSCASSDPPQSSQLKQAAILEGEAPSHESFDLP
jgi:hypothetical protein